MKEASDLSPNEVGRLVKLAEWGREYIIDRRETRAPVIVLTAAELFTPFSVQETWKQMGGRHAELIERGWVRVDDLRELADLTQQLYLNMPSYGTWFEARSKRQAARRQARLSADAEVITSLPK
jgi:hypothetical protein